MNNKKALQSLLGASLVGVVVAILLQRGTFAEFLFPFSVVFFLLALMIYFQPAFVFQVWGKFTLWYLPIAIVLVILAPSSVGGLGAFALGFDKELASWWLAAIFFIVSLILIIRTSRKVKREEVMKR